MTRQGDKYCHINNPGKPRKGRRQLDCSANDSLELLRLPMTVKPEPELTRHKKRRPKPPF